MLLNGYSKQIRTLPYCENDVKPSKILILPRYSCVPKSNVRSLYKIKLVTLRIPNHPSFISMMDDVKLVLRGGKIMVTFYFLAKTRNHSDKNSKLYDLKVLWGGVEMNMIFFSIDRYASCFA